MKKLLFASILFVTPWVALPAALVPDVIVLDGQELMLCAHPLSLRPDAGVLETKMFGAKGPNWSTACASGYIAHWEVVDSQLYLTRIAPCYSWDTTTFNLGNFFGEEYQNGRVKAAWVSSTISAVSGRCLYPVNSGFSSIYEKEMVLVFESGKLLDRQAYSNLVHRSAYDYSSDSLRNFVYASINWPRVPAVEAGEIIEVEISIQNGEKPVPDNVQVVKCYRYAKGQVFSTPDEKSAKQISSKALEKEVLRVVRKLPDWTVVMRKDKAQRWQSTKYIYFTKELRERYAKKK